MSLRLVPHIHRATHRIGLYLAHLREDGLSQGEAHILALLASSGPATIAELHRGLAHKRSTLTSILGRRADRECWSASSACARGRGGARRWWPDRSSRAAPECAPRPATARPHAGGPGRGRFDASLGECAEPGVVTWEASSARIRFLSSSRG